MTAEELRQFAIQHAQEQGVDPELVKAIGETESNFKPGAVSKAGAIGPMQLMPATAKSLGVDIRDPLDNIRGGVKLLKDLHEKYNGNPTLIAAAYNAGEPAVDKAGGVPNFPETQDYVKKVTGKMAIDPSKVQWDEPAIDPSKVQWDGPAVASPTPDPGAITKALTRSAMGGLPFGEYAPEMLKGITSGVHGMAQMGARGIDAALGTNLAPKADAWNKNTDDAYQRLFGDAPPGGKLAEGVAGSLVPMGVLGKIGQASSVMGRLASSIGIGAGLGATEPVQNPGEDFWQQKAKQAATSGALGAATYPLAAAAGRVLSPATNPNVKLLNDEGVTTTLGQTLGGVAHRVEDAATSIPLVGDMIKNAQRGAVVDFNKAVYNRALGPIGESIPSDVKPGNQAVGYVRDKLGDAYDALLPKMRVEFDHEFRNNITQLQDMTGTLPEGMQKQFDAIVKQGVFDKATPAGLMSGRTMKDVESYLGQKAKGYSSSPDPDQRQLGDAIEQVQANLRDLMARNNPAYAPQLRAINQGYANYTQLRRAAASVGANEGLVSPAQFQSAVRAGDGSVGKGRFAAGEARNQDLSAAGKAVLPSTVPDSGSITRGLVGLGVAHGAMGPMASLGAAASTIPYMPGVRQLLNSLLTQRPEVSRRLGGAISGAAPYLAAPVAGLLGP